MKSNKLSCPPPLETVELINNPINIDEVIVVGVDFFLMPKYKGMRLTPAIINALIKVAGTVAMISPTLTGVSKNPIIGFKKKINILMIKVAMIMLQKQNPKTIANFACMSFFVVTDR